MFLEMVYVIYVLCTHVFFFAQVLPTCSNTKSGIDNLELKTEPGNIWRGVLTQIDSPIMAGGYTRRKPRNHPCLLRTKPLDCNSQHKWQNQKSRTNVGVNSHWMRTTIILCDSWLFHTFAIRFLDLFKFELPKPVITGFIYSKGLGWREPNPFSAMAERAHPGLSFRATGPFLFVM